jgi:hypothetical protein
MKPTFAKKQSYQNANEYKIQTNGLYDTYQRLNGINEGLNKTSFQPGGENWPNILVSQGSMAGDVTPGLPISTPQSKGAMRFNDRKASV